MKVKEIFPQLDLPYQLAQIEINGISCKKVLC